ncbi:histidine kinase [Catenovulum agarivorans DS-2]|uniref:Histidine kinase n=1 Tax=Catenovulum agarivorans DS-2 TaxID=1328313 RepID=W7Q841_9ALTE|nr:Hpt domain-containing protein [Catenovulum agarivorans]EWH08136.1 histidine kinase [Catenovulum agarivorans DS-2]
MVIDKADALERLAGNEQLFVMLVNKFTDQYKNSTQEVANLVSSGQLKDAAVLVHSIKGAAGNLSMIELYNHAKALEAELRAENTAVDSMLTDFSQALQAVIDETSSW